MLGVKTLTKPKLTGRLSDQDQLAYITNVLGRLTPPAELTTRDRETIRDLNLTWSEETLALYYDQPLHVIRHICKVNR